MCPGFTKSDLPRHYADKGIGFTVGIAVFTGLFAKSSSNGARTYLAACLTKESEHVSTQLSFQEPLSGLDGLGLLTAE